MSAESDNEDVLVPRTHEVKVYLNENDDIVIKREAEEWEKQNGISDDSLYIVIPKGYVPALINRLNILTKASDS